MNKKHITLIIYLISTLIILTFGRSSFINRFYNKKETIVPNLIYLNEKEAIKSLKKYKLDYKIVYSKSEEVPENTVFIQDPLPDSIVKVNRLVQVWVNKSDEFELPNILGKSLVEGRRILNNLNITIERIDYMPNDNVEEDKIIAIYPRLSNKIAQNKRISLLVSSKSLIKNNIMPNLIGLDLNEANTILSQIGKSINLISDSSNPSFAKNVIIATNPLPGEELNENININVVLNTGIEIDKTITEIIEENTINNNETKNEDVKKILEDTLKELKEKENKEGN